LPLLFSASASSFLRLYYPVPLLTYLRAQELVRVPAEVSKKLEEMRNRIL
jgi:hypothetical protein